MYLNERYKIRVAVIIMILMFACGQARAEQTEFSSSLNPVGSGARATGMGGAFISVADDATAASWNPAGLVNLEKPEVSIVYSQFKREQTYASEEHPEINSEQNMNVEGINYASVAYPFVLFNRNMIVSVNYQRLFEMNKDYTFDYVLGTIDPTMEIVSESGVEDFDQDGYLYTLSPAAALQVIPELYVGVTYNMWDDFFGRNGWDLTSYQMQEVSKEKDLPFPISKTLEMYTKSSVLREEKNSFKGENWNLGFLYSLSDSITLGGVYKTSFSADFKKEKTVTTDILVRSGFTGMTPTETTATDTEITTEDFTLKMPPSYGLGLSYRHSDNLTVAFDMYRTEWSRFVLRDSDGNEMNPLTGADLADGRLKDTTQLRLGTEYLYITGRNIIPVRCGLFYDPEPATGHVDDYYGASFGTGFARGRIALDISYQYRTGDNVTSDFSAAAPDSTLDVDQHAVMASAIFYL